MKGYCLIAVIIAMVVFYQKEPVYTVVIVGAGVALYLFYKAKKSGKGLLGSFFGGNQAHQERNFDDLVALMMLQQLVSSNSRGSTAAQQISEDSQKRREQVNKVQKEIRDLLRAD
jgi:hypothetical protein